MSRARELLGRYLRQQVELGERELFLAHLDRSAARSLLTRGHTAVPPAAATAASAARRSPASATAASRFGAGDAVAGAQRDRGVSPAPGGAELDAGAIGAAASMRELQSLLAACPGCTTGVDRAPELFGQGSVPARLMIASAEPDDEEERAQRLFPGEVGQMLEMLLASIGLSRQDIYLTSIRKCSSPADSSAEDGAVCSQIFERQLELVQPRALLVLGGQGCNALLRSGTPLADLRGRPLVYESVPVVPTYHPRALIKNPVYSRLVWEDLQRARQLLDAQ